MIPTGRGSGIVKRVATLVAAVAAVAGKCIPAGSPDSNSDDGEPSVVAEDDSTTDGSQPRLAPACERELKGVPDLWRLLRDDGVRLLDPRMTSRRYRYWLVS